jgi:hypothetical protein
LEFVRELNREERRNDDKEEVEDEDEEDDNPGSEWRGIFEADDDAEDFNEAC